nr:tannase/feruloyl esterase family alpha/beta hydrolase [Methylobacterium sp. SD274]
MPRILAQQRQIGGDQRPFIIGNVGRVGGARRGHTSSSGFPTAQVHNSLYGNSGWSGTPQSSLSAIASDDIHAAAAAKGFVVATSDNGHVGSPIDGSFAMKPDGSINIVGWKDFSERSLQELADKTKKVTKAFYGRAHRYAYFDGFSTGGRQGLKLAQAFPDAFDGILVGAPAINWSKYHTANLYGQIAMKQDLGQLIGTDKLKAATQAAIKACGGSELGFIIDPLSCRYDPAKDTANLCKNPADKSDASEGNTSKTCLTPKEAAVINKAWYGQTASGTVPAPADDNGNGNDLSGKERIWFGYTRGTDLVTSSVGGGFGVVLAADQTALELQNPTLGSTYLNNATGKGTNRWLDALNYGGLTDAQAKGVQLQPEFSAINTDNPDLTKFAAAGGKIVMYQGMADEYIPAQGAINYYDRVTSRMGGTEAVQKFNRLYLVPGFTHSGRSEGAPSVPVPQPSSGRDEMFVALQNWVEKEDVPAIIRIKSSDNTVSLPLCVYPQKTTYRGTGAVKALESYSCN